MTDKLLTKAGEVLSNLGYVQIGSLDHGGGIDSMKFVRDDHRFLVVAKEYAYQNLASFQVDQVRLTAEADGVMLVFYEDRTGVFTVFDPEFVRAEADQSHGRSKRTDEEWRELPLSHGVSIEEYVRGTDMPDTLAGNNATLEAY